MFVEYIYTNTYRIQRITTIYYSNMNNMDWDGLRYFLAAADSGSLTAAARLLNSNQPTVGRHIDAIESELGIKLFQRSVKGLILTEEGKYIYEQSIKIQNSIVKIKRYVQSGNEKAKGTVKLSVPEGLGQEILIPALGEFYKKYPYINLVLNVSSNASNLTRGEADIAVRLFRPDEADLVIKHLGEMKMSLFASTNYIDKYSLPDKLESLNTHNVITYGEELSSLPENIWLLEHTIKSSHIFSSDSTAARLKATLTGIGISIQPEALAKLNTDLLQVLNEVNIPSHNVWLVYHKDLRHSERIRTVLNFLTTCLNKALTKY